MHILYGAGDILIPGTGSSDGADWFSGKEMANAWSILVKNRNNSILASTSPRQLLGPESTVKTFALKASLCVQSNNSCA